MARVSRIDTGKQRALQTDKGYISILGSICISDLIVIHTHLGMCPLIKGVKNKFGICQLRVLSSKDRGFNDTLNKMAQNKDCSLTTLRVL